MLGSIGWFLALAAVVTLLALLGQRLGRGSKLAFGLGAAAGVACMVSLACVSRRMELLLGYVPESVVEHLEGTAVVLPLALVLGLAWTRATIRRQRISIGVAAMAGVLFFLQGSLWMVLPAPVADFCQQPGSLTTRQSTYYSCVAAACATALGQLGVPASEAEMVVLTRTSPLTGATVLRAASGLRQRLRDTAIEPRIVRGGWEELSSLPMPALCTMQFSRGRVHMITVLEVRPTHALIVDPTDGQMWFPREAFERHSSGAMIAFVSRHDGHETLASAGTVPAAH